MFSAWFWVFNLDAGFVDLGLEFWFRAGVLDFGVGYRLPGGYTVEWFWGDFYMWLLCLFRCFRDFR